LAEVVKVGSWHIADDVLAALKVRYGVGCPAATYLGERPESALPRRWSVLRRRTGVHPERTFTGGAPVTHAPFRLAAHSNLARAINCGALHASHLYAALAEKERALISQRTRAALAAKKAQGVKLGNPRAAETVGKAHAANRAAADQFAANVLPIVRTIQATGISSFAGIAEALNARGIRTARGGTWHASTVRNLLARSLA
jgi:hypothetical protein